MQQAVIVQGAHVITVNAAVRAGRWDFEIEGGHISEFATKISEHGATEVVKANGLTAHACLEMNTEEVNIGGERTGMRNMEDLHQLGFTGPDVMLARSVWLSSAERMILRETESRVVHCSSANPKLARGIARVAEMLDEGIYLALGADSAACNNLLDGFLEMRLAALLHKMRGGPTAVPARQALKLATRPSAANISSCNTSGYGEHR